MTKQTSGLAALADELEHRRHPGTPCGVRLILERLNEADAEYLTNILASTIEEWRHTEIERLLFKAGHKCSSNTIGKHRRGDCQCGKS